MSSFAHKYKSLLGEIVIASDGAAITGLWFVEQRHFDIGLEGYITDKDLPIFDEVSHWLDIYFTGNNPGEIPAVRMNGTPFQMEVWRILQTVPYGKLITYREMAEYIAQKRNIVKMSAQAVGNAVGRNPISILVPCHRVIGSNGKMTGYAGGIEKKVKLLKLENAI
jgi:methylated-DNA--[protein]-cysteine S-methyltransferase